MSAPGQSNDHSNDLTEKVSKLNVNASEFKPNPFAASFVPSKFTQSSTTSTKASPKKPASESSQPSHEAKATDNNQAKHAEKTTPQDEHNTQLDEYENLLDEHFKEHFSVVFIGHVDAGKSTLGGNILYLTGMVDKRTLEKYEKEAKEANRETWYLSWALDTNAEERAKGKTVETGRAYFETEHRRYTILDAPGHKNFVPSMIGGAAQADIGVLVISARKGEFETGFEKGGQTREHAVLAKTSGVRKLVVVINKMDDPTVMWSKERYDECVTKLTPFLKATGYNPKTDIVFLPISGYTGANVKTSAKDLCPWYSGPTLLDLLDTMDAIERKFNAPLRLPISEKFKDMGTIVGGKVESGCLKKGQSLLLMPIKRSVDATSIYSEEEEVNVAHCGDNVRIRLRGVEEEEISSGFVLCDRKNPLQPVTSFDAELVILEHKNIICAGYNAVLHIHTVVEEVTITGLLHLIDKKTHRRSKRPPPYVKQGQRVIARLETTMPLCAEKFKDFPQLGRFILRDEGKTIAIGKVVKLSL